ncbi:MAG TPA: DUF3558 domain-containing protein [Mycobacterium sp.]|nr:DUF3558 domain-containing protein [Mycobacterium sp.]
MRCRYPAAVTSRKLPSLIFGASVVVALVAGCSHGSSSSTSNSVPSSAPPKQATHGPFFPECGGVSDETVSQLTQVTGLKNTARNSAGCQWLQGGGIMGPHFSFTWYRGSPIGRERKTEEVQRTSVDDVNIDGHAGFIAVQSDPTVGDSLCEIGIQFNDDFIEWSISFSQQPFPPPCDVAKQLTHQSIANSK